MATLETNLELVSRGRSVVEYRRQDGRDKSLSRPRLLVDAQGREIDFYSLSDQGGAVVSRANSGFPWGGTGYADNGASFRRRALASWLPTVGSADTDIVTNLPLLRGRSRDLFMGFPIARAAIETKVRNVVGTGIRPMPLPDGEVLGLSDDDCIKLSKLMLREWRNYMECPLCDWDRQHDVYTKQAELYRTKEHSGDAPLLFAYRQDGAMPYDLKLRTVDPDRILNPYTIPVPTWENNVWGGIEYDHFNGPLVAYWVAQFNPNDYGLLPQMIMQKWERVKVFSDQYLTRNACLHMNVERAGQRRGVPPLAVCLEMGKGMQRFNHEKIQKEVISNMFAVFITSPMPTDDTFRAFGFTNEQIKEFYKIFPYDVQMSPGGMTFMKPGDKVEFAAPPLGATDYKVYNETNGIIFCASIQVPYEIALMHFGNSYSASKAAFGEFFKTVLMDRQLHINQIDNPIWENFIGQLVLKRVLRYPKYFTDLSIRRALSRCLWTGVSAGTIEPLKEIQAAMLRVQLGVSTVQREAAEFNNSNWEENVLQIAKEKKVFEENDLQYLMFAGIPTISTMKTGDEQKDAESEGGKSKTSTDE